ncbi:MAG: AraC family transcriptional regulator [Ketobacteraceae bacterium]|nr:AraC family transcriptional regulator [Ketobacteraceae bacterium]
MSTRSVLGLVYTLEALKAHGFSVDPILDKYGLSLDTLSPEAEVERSLELQIYTELMDQMDDPLTGLYIGKRMSLAGYGQFIMLLMSCQNAWEALKTGEKYQQLTYLFGQLSMETGEKESALVITPVPLPKRCERFLIDRDISGTYQLISDIQQNIGVSVKPLRIEIPYPRPPEHAAYEERFGCPVHFGKDRIRAVISNKDLAIRFPGANRTAFALYQKQCDLVLSQRDSQAGQLADNIAKYLALFSEKLPTAEDAAVTFGLSQRSLRRKLSQEGTSFRKLLDDVKSRKAIRLLLNTRMTIEAIAQELGYAEAAAFVHAFRRWENDSPAQYRIRHRNTGDSP